jgi:hypothetical protein
MILKKPIHDVETSQLLLETAALAVAVLVPAARVPALILTSLSLLCKWAVKATSTSEIPILNSEETHIQ